MNTFDTPGRKCDFASFSSLRVGTVLWQVTIPRTFLTTNAVYLLIQWSMEQSPS